MPDTPASPDDAAKKKSNALGWICFGLFTLFVVVGGACLYKFPLEMDWWLTHIAKVCQRIPFFIGLLMLAVLWLLYGLISRNASLLELIRGKDGRFSISKCQFFLWTGIVFFSYVSMVAALIGARLLGLFATGGFGDLPANLLLAMGLSVTTVLAAKGIAVNQINSGTVARDTGDADAAKYGDLLKDDDGAIDLSKVQMMGWTLIGLAAYLASVVRMVHQIGLGKAPGLDGKIALPDIDAALMVLMGLGQGTYLVKKMIATATPSISGIKGTAPGKARVGGEVTISGSGFGNEKAGSVITFNGMNTNFPISTWSATAITFTLQDATLQMAPGVANLCVVASNQQSNPIALTVLPPPAVTAVKLPAAATDKTLTVTGSNFASQQGTAAAHNLDQIVITGPTGTQLTEVINWADTSIQMKNADPVLKVGDQVRVSFVLNGEKVPEVTIAVM